VGYIDIPAPAGLSLATPAFIPVGGDGTVTRLGDVTVPSVGADDEFIGNIQFLESDGAITTAVYWNYPDEDPEWNFVGWFDLTTAESYNDKLVAPGTAFILTSNGGATTLRTKGEVKQTATDHAAPSGLSIVGNMVPRNITLGDVSVPSVGADDEFIGNIQFLESDGTITTAVYWNYPDEDPEWNFVGWFDLTTAESYNERTLIPGDSFILTSNAGTTSLAFPAAL